MWGKIGHPANVYEAEMQHFVFKALVEPTPRLEDYRDDRCERVHFYAVPHHDRPGWADNPVDAVEVTDFSCGPELDVDRVVVYQSVGDHKKKELTGREAARQFRRAGPLGKELLKFIEDESIYN